MYCLLLTTIDTHIIGMDAHPSDLIYHQQNISSSIAYLKSHRFLGKMLFENKYTFN